MVVIVISDTHLGYKRADKPALREFLDEVAKRTDVSDLVMLGDFVDMWRRDCSGVFLENRDIIERFVALKEKKNIDVHMVAGNHDYHTLQLKNHDYSFQFLRNLRLERNGRQYRFLHGYEWDPLQQPVFMEGLCHVMNDSVGGDLTAVWDIIKGGEGIFGKLKLPKNYNRERALANLAVLRKPPHIRLRGRFGEVEKKACRSVGKGEILVFGHTHRPFVNQKENVVNTGSWVMNERVHNTFAELLPDKVSLKVFRGSEITERVEC